MMENTTRVITRRFSFLKASIKRKNNTPSKGGKNRYMLLRLSYNIKRAT
jgi:hypothetical protein